MQAALEQRDNGALDMALRRDLLIHGLILSQSGIPVIYSGDEIAARNDYSYKNDPAKAGDSRFLHRGVFSWEAAQNRHNPDTVEGRMFTGLQKLISLRRGEPLFDADAAVHTADCGNPHALVLVREKDGRCLMAVFNFSESWQELTTPLVGGRWVDLVSGDVMEGSIGWMQPCQMRWLVPQEETK